MVETIGRRIAYLRQKFGLTQAGLVKRLAISHVAISHIEIDHTIPRERTITLLAGIFNLSPINLVEGTPTLGQKPNAYLNWQSCTPSFSWS